MYIINLVLSVICIVLGVLSFWTADFYTEPLKRIDAKIEAAIFLIIGYGIIQMDKKQESESE
jgi:hypothetical protein